MSSNDDYLLKLKRNQIKMFRDRDYDVSDELWILDENLNGHKFKKELIKKLGEYPIRKLMFSEYTHKTKKNMFVYYVNIEKDCKQIKIETIKSFIFKMTTENKDGILIINSILSPSAIECLSMITEHYYQIFKEEELLFNISNHTSYSKHVLLEEHEILELRASGITPKGLPWICHTDPVAKYYGFKINNYIKIEVNMEDLNIISNEYYNYRVVI
jgi:DNA-directed RNA polymerase subunit H (RpoH/RPB5)